MKLAGKNLKKCVLELGGSDPFIVLPDANLELVSKMAAASRMINSGQSCIAAKRFLVHDSISEVFAERISFELDQFRPGNPILDGNWFSLGEHDCACNPVSVDEMENFQFSVYPNPSTDWVTVNLHGKVVSASLVDAFGKSIGQYRNLSSKMQLQLNVENLTGIYLLHVQTMDGKFHTKKVIIR